MNQHLALIPITGLALLTLAGCATTPNGNGANNNLITNSTANTSGANAVSNSTGATSNTALNTGNDTNSTQVSVSSTITSKSDYVSKIALIKNKGYSVSRSTPNASVQTASGDILTAWITTAMQSQDGYNQLVFFFLNGKYLETDTAKPSVEITSAKAAGNGIAVTYPVYKKNDSFANPTGTPVTITYTWNGSKLVSNRPYPEQFQATNTTTQGQNPISTKLCSTSTEAANQIASIQGGQLSGVPVNLGYGITGKQSAGLGHARYEWQEGKWAIEVRYYTMNRGVKQVAENMVSYLHTHMLPAPNDHGVIIVNSTATGTTFKPKTIIAWQEGTKVSELQQSGNPIQTMQTVVNNK